VLAGLALLGSTIPARAHAAPPPQPPTAAQEAEAERFAQQAKAAADKGDVKSAIDLFERAYLATPNWRLAWNIAKLREASGDLLGARRWLVKARAHAGDPRQASKTLEELGALDAKLVRQGYVHVAVRVRPPEAVVLIDGDPIEVDGGSAEAWIKAGRHRLQITAPGHLAIDEVVEAKAGTELRLDKLLAHVPLQQPEPKAEPKVAPKPDPRLVPKPGPKPAAKALPQPNPLPARWPGWVVTGAGAVAVGVGTWLALDGVSKAQAAIDMPSATAAHKAAREDAYHSAGSRHAAGLVTAGVGVVAVGAGLWLVLSTPAAKYGDAEEDAPAPRVVWAPTGVTVRF